MSKKTLLLAFVPLAVFGQVAAQSEKEYRNFPLVISLQFHALSLPFRDLKSNLGNVGVVLGTEVSHNGGHDWAQQFSVLWIRNRAVGNGILIHTQTAWRPTIGAGVYTEVKAGAGYLYAFRPTESYRPVNGTWVGVGHKGKGMLAVPVGVSIGYNKYSSETYVSPFVSYQFVVLSGYNKSIPIVPETLLQVGSRIHF
jgi:hypothetical protein